MLKNCPSAILFNKEMDALCGTKHSIPTKLFKFYNKHNHPRLGNNNTLKYRLLRCFGMQLTNLFA